MNLTQPPMPWPDDQTPVFRKGGKVWFRVWDNLSPNPQLQWGLYASGYQDAAELLHSAWQAQRRCPEYVVLPIVFLYRHHVEVSLKEIWRGAATLFPGGPVMENTHKLEEIWKKLHWYFGMIWDEPKDITNAERLVIELAALDPNSFTCRYPEGTRRDGNEQPLAALEDLDMDNFMKAMGQLAAFLSAVSNAVYMELHPEGP